MTGRVILGGGTSHRRGFGVQPIIDAAARRAQTTQPQARVIWLVPSYLKPAFNAARGIGNTSEIRTCDTIGPPLWALIENEIESVRSTAPGAEVTVVTWDQFIYGEAFRHGRGLIADKWFDWLPDNRGERFLAPPPPTRLRPVQPSAALPHVVHLKAMVVEHLKSAGATSKDRALYRSQLRPALTLNTGSLQPFSSNPLFGPRFKAALDAAISEGAIFQECSVPGKERIWISEATRPAELSEKEVEINEQSPVPSIPTAPKFERSAQFRKRLTDLGIFCEKRERDILMEALEQLLRDGPLVISRLRRELPKAATQIAAKRGVCSETKFSRIANFFLKLLLVSGALAREGGITIQRNASAESTAVTGLVEGSVDVVESYLLEQILKKSDVKDREHWQLALALLREFDESSSIDDKLDRIASLIGGLADLIVLTDDGVYEYTGSAPTGVRTIRAATAS